MNALLITKVEWMDVGLSELRELVMDREAWHLVNVSPVSWKHLKPSGAGALSANTQWEQSHS